jgi:hypothetical protein
VNRGCPLLVKSGHDVLKIAMSALLPKARIGGRPLDVRFVPRADIDRAYQWQQQP